MTYVEDWGVNDDFYLKLIAEGHYYIKNGLLHSGRLKRPIKHKKKYSCVSWNDREIGRKRHISVHRLTYLAAHGPIEKRHSINHKDGRAKNNHADNLEADTHSHNITHAHHMGLIRRSKYVD